MIHYSQSSGNPVYFFLILVVILVILALRRMKKYPFEFLGGKIMSGEMKRMLTSKKFSGSLADCLCSSSLWTNLPQSEENL